MTSPQPLPKTIKGIEIYSRGTERLREEYADGLKRSIELFCRDAGLADMMFLSHVLDQWEQDAATLTRRCLVADLALQLLGGDGEKGFQQEEMELSLRQRS